LHTSAADPREITAYENAFGCTKKPSGNASASMAVPRKCMRMQIQAWLNEEIMQNCISK
jgi:hypothetical protein